MSGISTHVLDTSLGRPAAGVPVALERQVGNHWQSVGQGTTNQDGRTPELLSGSLVSGTYRITFDTGAYFRARGQQAFYPQVQVVFTVADTGQHYHVPLLLNPYGYSTYRGS